MSHGLLSFSRLLARTRACFASCLLSALPPFVFALVALVGKMTDRRDPFGGALRLVLDPSSPLIRTEWGGASMPLAQCAPPGATIMLAAHVSSLAGCSRAEKHPVDSVRSRIDNSRPRCFLPLNEAYLIIGGRLHRPPRFS